MFNQLKMNLWILGFEFINLVENYTMKYLFVFLLIGLTFNSFGQEANEKYCKKIEVEVDKFTGDTTYTSPHSQGFIDPLFYIKKNGETMVYLKGYGSTVNVGKNGAILLLKDGKKIERANVSIDCDVNGAGATGFLYTTLFSLTTEEIEMLSNSPVISVRLYIYDMDYNEKRQIKQMEYLRCLQTL